MFLCRSSNNLLDIFCCWCPFYFASEFSFFCTCFFFCKNIYIYSARGRWSTVGFILVLSRGINAEQRFTIRYSSSHFLYMTYIWSQTSFIIGAKYLWSNISRWATPEWSYIYTLNPKCRSTWNKRSTSPDLPKC